MNTKQQLRRYYRQIRGGLPCAGKMKASLLSQIQESVEAYAQEHPEADFAQLQRHFGSPEEIAAAYVRNADTVELLRILRIRKKVLNRIGAVLLASLIIWAGFVAWAIKETNDANNGYYAEYASVDANRNYKVYANVVANSGK